MGVASNTVDDVVHRSAARYPERRALTFEDRSWTYRDLDEAVSRVAGRLLASGCGKGDRVAAFGRNSDAYLLLYLGCARAGLVHVPINYNLTREELAYLVTQSGSTLLAHDPAFADVVTSAHDLIGDIRLVTLLRGDSGSDVLAWSTDGPVPEIDVDVSGDDLVQLLYTSGTTAAPKGSMMTHHALVAEYVSSIVALELAEHDTPLHALPLYHSAQMHVFLLPYLMLGASNILVTAPDPADVLRRIEEQGIDSFFAPPTVWIALANHPEFGSRDLTALKRAYYGASIMPAAVLQKLRAALPTIGFYNCFGQSEIGPLATVLRPEEHDVRLESAGRPVLFVEMRVVDDELNDVPVGDLGEVVYRSPQLCTGYWDKPDETAEAFAGGWFHSGDLVRRDAEGYIFVVDRKKDVINTGGVIVASGEVENALYTHTAVREVAVVGTPDERWIEAVTAIVVARRDVTEKELIDHVRGHLAPFKVPKSVHFADDLPHNASGKVLKRVLRDRFSG
ncbi:MAG TPA: acyl-CoA synthetase [Streptosporangiaceae bacterium]|nr:acyl-CoA synthetase [Streptosporangiaceae bacterium]